MDGAQWMIEYWNGGLVGWVCKLAVWMTGWLADWWD